MSQTYRYEPRILRVNLTTGTITRETKDAAWGRKYVGGMGFGTRLLWEELPPETAWNSPDNKLIFSLGALTGTTVCGSGLCCVNTIGSLTNGLSSAQTLGHWGSCLRRAGYDILIVEGEAPEWQYLFLGEDTAELRQQIIQMVQTAKRRRRRTSELRQDLSGGNGQQSLRLMKRMLQAEQRSPWQRCRQRTRWIQPQQRLQKRTQRKLPEA